MRKRHRSPKPSPFSRRDAERYQFLRENQFTHWRSIAGTPDRVEIRFVAEGASREAVDAAIDAAIARKERKG